MTSHAFVGKVYGTDWSNRGAKGPLLTPRQKYHWHGHINSHLSARRDASHISIPPKPRSPHKSLLRPFRKANMSSALSPDAICDLVINVTNVLVNVLLLWQSQKLLVIAVSYAGSQSAYVG